MILTLLRFVYNKMNNCLLFLQESLLDSESDKEKSPEQTSSMSKYIYMYICKLTVLISFHVIALIACEGGGGYSE